jgi:hypothetical protein
LWGKPQPLFWNCQSALANQWRNGLMNMTLF